MLKGFDIWLYLTYYLWIFPISLIVRLFRIDILEMNFSKKKDTYWVKCSVDSKSEKDTQIEI